MIAPLAPEIRGRALPQFAINQREQFIPSLKISPPPGQEQPSRPGGSIDRTVARLHRCFVM
jgi:hypothetical protein